MAKRPHKWKIRAGLAILATGIYKVQAAIREVIDTCDVQTSQACHHAQNGLRNAIYVAVTGAVVVIYGYVKRVRRLRKSITDSI